MCNVYLLQTMKEIMLYIAFISECVCTRTPCSGCSSQVTWKHDVTDIGDS